MRAAKFAMLGAASLSGSAAAGADMASHGWVTTLSVMKLVSAAAFFIWAILDASES